MQFVLFNDFVPGVIVGDRVVDISSQFPQRSPKDVRALVRELISSWDEIAPRVAETARAAEGILLSSVRLRAPSPLPDQLLCAAKNYKDGHETPKPDFFLKPL